MILEDYYSCMSDMERLTSIKTTLDRVGVFNDARIRLGELATLGAITLPVCVITPDDGVTLTAKHYIYTDGDWSKHNGNKPIAISDDNPFIAGGEVVYTKSGFAHIRFSTPIGGDGFSESFGPYSENWVLTLDPETLASVSIIPN